MHLPIVVCCLLLAVWISFQLDESSQWTYFSLPSKYFDRNCEFQRLVDGEDKTFQTKCDKEGDNPYLVYWFVDSTNQNHVVFVYVCDGDKFRDSDTESQENVEQFPRKYIKVDRTDKNKLTVVKSGTELNQIGIVSAGYEQYYGNNDGWSEPQGDNKDQYKAALLDAIKDQLKEQQQMQMLRDGKTPSPWSKEPWTDGDIKYKELCPCAQTTGDPMYSKQEGEIYYVRMRINCLLREGTYYTIAFVEIALDSDLETWSGRDTKTAKLVVLGTTLYATTFSEDDAPVWTTQCNADLWTDGEASSQTCYKPEKDAATKIGPGFTLFIASLLWILAAFRRQ